MMADSRSTEPMVRFMPIRLTQTTPRGRGRACRDLFLLLPQSPRFLRRWELTWFSRPDPISPGCTQTRWAYR